MKAEVYNLSGDLQATFTDLSEYTVNQSKGLPHIHKITEGDFDLSPFTERGFAFTISAAGFSLHWNGNWLSLEPTLSEAIKAAKRFEHNVRKGIR